MDDVSDSFSFIEDEIEKYNNSKKDTIDIINCMSLVYSYLMIDSKSNNSLTPIIPDILSELVGLSTEVNSLKEKVINNSTVKVITNYMLSYIDNIEKETINSSNSKLTLDQKLKKFTNDYIATNYFRKIIIVTVVDDIISSVYGDEYSLSRHILLSVKDLKASENPEFQKFILIYQNVIDNADINTMKLTYRKTLIDKLNYENILNDIWLRLNDFLGFEGTIKIYNSLSDYSVKKTEYNKKILSPILKEIDESNNFISEEYKEIELNGVKYYGTQLYTLEENNITFERFAIKLKKLGYKREGEILSEYIVNNIGVLTEKIIGERFSNLPKELFDDLMEMNRTKLEKTLIGYIVLGEPTENVFDEGHTINFIFSMIMRSIFKMTEILLLNDFEFQEFQKEMLATLQEISKLRDIETFKHQERVTIYTKILAEALLKKRESGQLEQLINDNKIDEVTDYIIISNEYIRDLLYSASLHDLGKVGIEDNILKSHSKLTDKEYEVMKQHTTFGQQKLSSITKQTKKKTFLALASVLAENHHERWDGFGYPHGKREFEIPLSARILAVADVYDALRQKRSYKEAYTHDKAVEIIVEGKGTHFDPVIVDIFIEKNQLLNETFVIYDATDTSEDYTE